MSHWLWIARGDADAPAACNCRRYQRTIRWQRGIGGGVIESPSIADSVPSGVAERLSAETDTAVPGSSVLPRRGCGRTGGATIAGTAAAALHGAKWIDDDVPVELIHENPRAPQGVLTRRDVLLEGEVQTLAGRAVTTPERTAFDIGRRAARRSAVARLDALARATGFKVETYWASPRATAERADSASWKPCLSSSTRAHNLRGRVIFGCCSSRLVCLGRTPRFRYSAWTVFRSPTSTWAGQSSWSPSNTTVTTIESTDSSISKTFAGWSSWNGWAGSSSGWSPRTGPPK